MKERVLSSPLLFIHIPKTAGTSFRMALESSFGPEKVCYDYNKYSDETSDLVKSLIYREEDYYRFKKKLDKHGYSALSGHFHYGRYGPLFNLSDVVTFVRDPVARMVSEYLHYQRHKGYKKSLIDFCNNSGNKNNTLGKYLRGIQWPAMGFVGLTEEYDTSIKLLNDAKGLDFPVLTENSAPIRQKKRLAYDEETEEVLKKLNAKDIDLYKKIRFQFRQRVGLKENNLPFTNGAWDIDNSGQVNGFAFRIGDVNPVLVSIFHKGVLVSQVKALNFEKGLARFRAPRKAYVGFKAKLNNWKQGDSLSIVVDDTEQELIYIGESSC